tara:strand:- start:32328 stop:33140 length:813 start_codon:yes stop_codon:yes gene_type:complete
MSDTANVKLGVCRVYYDGNDLGYTKGGVEVEVSTDTHKVTVDQFGLSEINEYIQKRSVNVKVPLAETTLENLVAIMPGATLIDNATKQIDTIVVAAAANTELYTVTVDGVAFDFTSGAAATQGEICVGIVALINADPTANVVASTTAIATDAVSSDVLLTGKISGSAFVATVTVNVTTGTTTPAADGAKRVDVTNGIGTNLLSIARELILHPKDAPDNNDDFIVPLAATPGGMNFSYKFDDERIYNAEFMGYPDTANNEILFKVGDNAAV